MHGGFGSGPQLETQSQLSLKADKENFIVVYPDGVKSPLGIRTWNAGVCCGYSADQNIDDVGFIRKLIDTLGKKYRIDANRIYATGMSNGGFMSYRLACEMGDVLAAIAPVAASMNTSCNYAEAIPIIHFHSYLDSNVPYQGGRGDGVSNHYNPPLDSVLKVWATQSGCLKGIDTLRNATDYDLLGWSDCDCDADYLLYLTHDGGHSWPGGKKSAVGDPVSTAIAANDLMWEFFKNHPRCDAASGLSNLSSGISKMYPNPLEAGSLLNIETEGWITEISIDDGLGRVVLRDKVDSDKFTIKSDWAPGVYFVRYIDSIGNIQVLKLMIQ